MKVKLNMNTWGAVMLSAGFAVLAAMNGAAQEQKDPFRKEQAGKTAVAVQPKQPSLVSVEMRIVEMPRVAADELFKEQGGLAKAGVINEATLGAISEMLAKNKAKVVSQSKLITLSGANCENKAVREYVYSSEYDVRGSRATNSVKVLPDSGNNAPDSGKALAGMLIPTKFETRDCGSILNVTPVVGPSGSLIDVICIFQRTRLSAFPNKVTVNSPAGKIEVEQPVFLSDNLTVAFAMANGTTMLVSVTDAVADQEKQEKAGDNINLFLMTAWVVSANAVGTP